jgi:hypothetical protein
MDYINHYGKVIGPRSKSPKPEDWTPSNIFQQDFRTVLIEKHEETPLIGIFPTEHSRAKHCFTLFAGSIGIYSEPEENLRKYYMKNGVFPSVNTEYVEIDESLECIAEQILQLATEYAWMFDYDADSSWIRERKDDE